MSEIGRFRVGTSGYHYLEWCGRHYPEGAPPARWFGCYAEMFDTVEVNNTFYGVPAEGTFDGWRDRAPEGFLYAIKTHRDITHRRRLRRPEAALDELVARAERLEDRLGPFLVQLPPRWSADAERLDAFLHAVPKRHRWAVEAREESWLCEEVYAVLRKHGAALVLHDLPGGPGGAEAGVLTADWTYLRYHGEDYAGPYGEPRLEAEAERIRRWLARGIDVYAYFNNTKDGSAVDDARALRRLVEGQGSRRDRSARARAAAPVRDP